MTTARTIEQRRGGRAKAVRYGGADPLVKLIVERIAEAVRPTRIYVYGSRVKGTATPESDVDVLILADTDARHRDIQLQVHRLFSSPAIALDVSVMRTDDFEQQRGIANTLAREVHENGVLCYERGGTRLSPRRKERQGGAP